MHDRDSDMMPHGPRRFEAGHAADVSHLGLLRLDLIGPDGVLDMQRVAGNQATGQLMRNGGMVQRDDTGVTAPGAGAGAAEAEAARVAALEGSYQTSVRAVDWRQAATDLNGFSDDDIRTKVRALSHEQLVELAGAARRAMPLWHERVTSAIATYDSEADRVGALNATYDAAVATEDWDEAVVALNGFNDMDIIAKLGRLSPDQLSAMKSAAEDTPVGGGRMARLVSAAAGVDISIRADEQVGGSVYTVRGGYTYELTPTAVIVNVGMDFEPDDDVVVPVGDWFGYINEIWNHFSAVNQQNRAEKFSIEFNPYQGSGHDIRVSSGSGRANAGHYYTGASDNGEAVPHEFGHLIGLQDEYERDAADFQAVTGQAPGAGDGDTATATTIATAIHEALFRPAEHWYNLHRTRERQRMAAVNQVLADHHIVANYQNSRSPLTRQVSIQYLAIYGHEMSVDFMDSIDTDNDEFNTWREQVLGTFQSTSTSIMGDMSVDHAHAVEPRHVRDIAGYVQQALGRGIWQPERDH